MSKKLEEDYHNFNKKIEQHSEEALKKIREKANEIKEEATKIGQAFEGSMKEKKSARKKINT